MRLHLLFASIFSAVVAYPLFYALADQPSTLPGWTHASGTDESPGIVLPGRAVTFSSPAVADIDGNPDNGLEVAVAGADGQIYVYRNDGSLLWSAKAPNADCGNMGSSSIDDSFSNSRSPEWSEKTLCKQIELNITLRQGP